MVTIQRAVWIIRGNTINDANATALANAAIAAVPTANPAIGNDAIIYIPNVDSYQRFIEFDEDIPFTGLDYGDAPASYGIASHTITNCDVWLGNTIDVETGMQHDANAQGDDNNGADDEDGVTFIGGASGAPGETKTLTIGIYNTCHYQRLHNGLDRL